MPNQHPDNPNLSSGSEFQSVLYYKFIFKHEYSKDELAVFLNKAPDTAYRYCSGHLPVTADLARDIIEFVHSKNPEDSELEAFFLGRINKVAVAAPDADNTEHGPTQDQEFALMLSTGRAADMIERAFGDKKYTKAEHRNIRAELRRVAQKALGLEKKLAGEAK
jgi:hypothetical protein